jgi:signal peptidase II
MLVLCLGFGVAVLDQLTKHLTQANIPYGHQVPIIPGFFSLSHVHNTGAAWGMLQGYNRWLIGLSFVMLGMVIAFRRHFLVGSRLAHVAAGLILGGIVGNLVDRVRLGYVVDFLDFLLWGYPFPSFNIADSSICIGVGLYMVTQFKSQEHVMSNPNASSPENLQA